MNFLAQLPELLRDPLLSLPLGPDRAVTANKVIEEMVEDFHFTESYSRKLLHGFIVALGSWVAPGSLDHLRSQLPVDFHPYFEPIFVSQVSEPSGPAMMPLESPAFEDGGEIPKSIRVKEEIAAHRSPGPWFRKEPKNSRSSARIPIPTPRPRMSTG